MSRSFRSSALAYVALLSTATAALVVGCAESADPDFDETTGVDAAIDTAPTEDTRLRADSSSTKDGSSGVNEDSGTEGDDGGNGDAAPDSGDAGKTDASDAGKTDASDAGKTDASDAGNTDSGNDAGGDAGDAGGSTAPKPIQGEVVISEVMYNPSGTETVEEWIEIYNTTASPRLLSGLVLKDGTSPAHTHTIKAGIEIAGGAYVVLVRNNAGALAAKVPAAAIVYDYGAGTLVADQITLGNSNNGSIVLLDGTTEIARAKYGALNLGNAADGQSIQLKTLTYAGADVAGNWCKSANAWATGADKGTPGAPSDCL